MKKAWFISWLMILVALWVIPQTWVSHTPAASSNPPTAPRAAAQRHLPADVALPAALPAQITDPILLEAWIRLYNATEPFELWEGQTVTGRALAENLRDRDIPVVWDTDGVCGNASCTHQYCVEERCTYEDGQPGVDAIHMYPGQAGNLPALIATLAHESFHRTQPFGPVRVTKFEEFWACRISAEFDAQTGFKFEGYDPLVLGWLILWIRDNNFTPYYALPNYPPDIAAELGTAAAR